ncbi:MAG: hypothetical protein GY756_22285, partial [bacterium]|nr:hypothetical protein [bacterium]
MIKSSVIGPVAVFLLFILSFIIRFIALKQTPYANGWDGYYYIMQSYTFLERGAMRSLDYSLIYPFYIAVSFIVKDYILA